MHYGLVGVIYGVQNQQDKDGKTKIKTKGERMVNLAALPGSLDLFELLVNYVAGGIFLSLILWAFILLITGILGRMSMQSILVIIITYGVAVGVGYAGAIAVVPVFGFALWYMLDAIFKAINRWGN